jgi:hypothetical protein
MHIAQSAAIALALCAGAACHGSASVTNGDGGMWLVSSQALPMEGEHPRGPLVADIAGRVTAIDPGPTIMPAPGVVWIQGGDASRSVTIQADDANEWTLGYAIQLGKPPRDATPPVPALVGHRVRLLARVSRSFGIASGFVLSDEEGVVFALDAATFGDALKPDDVPGLTISDGDTVGMVEARCFDQRHRSLVFTGDAPVSVRPGEQATVSIQGRAYTAVTLFNYAAASAIRCTDVSSVIRAWALWRPSP